MLDLDEIREENWRPVPESNKYQGVKNKVKAVEDYRNSTQYLNTQEHSYHSNSPDNNLFEEYPDYRNNLIKLK